jgi:hypothetical protein
MNEKQVQLLLKQLAPKAMDHKYYPGEKLVIIAENGSKFIYSENSLEKLLEDTAPEKPPVKKTTRTSRKTSSKSSQEASEKE